MDLLVSQNMVHHLSRVQMKHLSIPANQSFINSDYVFTGALPDFVVIGLMSDANLAGGYQKTRSISKILALTASNKSAMARPGRPRAIPRILRTVSN